MSERVGGIYPSGHLCVVCGEVITEEDCAFPFPAVVVPVVSPGPDGLTHAVYHGECQALSIVGHVFSVCTCTGWEPGRAAALELRRKIESEEPL